MIARRWVMILGMMATTGSFPVRAQEPASAFKTLDELHASYAKQALELDRKRIGDLTTLAASQTGDEAEMTYRELFGLAVARDLYDDAEPAARQYLKSGATEPQDRAIAALVIVIAQADRGEYDQSLATLKDFLQHNPAETNPAKRLEPGTVIAIGEAYLQRLLRGGRYDIATKACDMVIGRRPEPEIRDHFRSRINRIKMVGQPAPEIEGKDIDGKVVRLSDLKGKVVLLDFWATWCPPCVAAFPDLKAIHSQYEDDGFEILGVNLDAHRDDVDGLAKASPIIREFLLHYRASWPNILVGEPDKGDPADVYDIDEIPASFLIDREGKIIQIELTGKHLSKAIGEALKK